MRLAVKLVGLIAVHPGTTLENYEMYGADIISLIQEIDVIKNHFLGLYTWKHLPKVSLLL